MVPWDLCVSDAHMDGVDFVGADLRRSRFVRVSFCHCDLPRANLQEVTFTSCDLRGDILGDARLEGAWFDGSWPSAVEGLTPAQWRHIAERGGLFF